ncbi:MAG: glutaminase [Prochlorococcaceae cyanobacterium]
MQSPERTADAIQRILEDLHSRYRDFDEGKPHDRIPELAQVDPRDFGIVIATTDGCVDEIGETGQEFTIQSISKPFTDALALTL